VSLELSQKDTLVKVFLIYYNRSTICQVHGKENAEVTNVRQVPTTEMQVTSIRLEQELKEHLKELAGYQGYQALIREILWEYVQQRQHDPSVQLHGSQIRATLAATAQGTEYCSLTGQIIHPHEPMLLGLTVEGRLVSLSINCFEAALATA
jgi:predicted transcriptional regulator